VKAYRRCVRAGTPSKLVVRQVCNQPKDAIMRLAAQAIEAFEEISGFA
jgi:hypothetical protein